MSISVRIKDGDGSGMEASIRRRNGERGLVVFNEELRDRNASFSPAFNSEFGVQMAQDFSFSGTPVEVHDGIDNTYWTATAISGTKFTFNSTTVANSGTRSIESNKPKVGDIMQLDKGSNQALSTYSALTLFIYVASGWAPSSADSFSIYGWDTGTGLQVGDAVQLESYFNETTFGVWHKLVIPLEDMNLQAATIDSFRIETAAKSGGGVLYYIDDFQIEETSGIQTFSVSPPSKTKYFVTELDFTLVDALSTTLASNSMVNLAYDSMLGVPSLPNGVLFQRINDDAITTTATIKTVGDFLSQGAIIKHAISDGTNTSIGISINFDTPLILNELNNDRLDLVVSDDLSGLLSFIVIAKGYTVETSNG